MLRLCIILSVSFRQSSDPSTLQLCTMVGHPMDLCMMSVDLRSPRPDLETVLRHIALQGGGLRVNNNKVDDEGYVMSEGDLIDGRLVLLACGKKNKLLLRVE